MTYNMRCLAIFIGSLKVYNVRYILSYKLQNIKLYVRNAVKYSFSLSCIDSMLKYGLKTSSWYYMIVCKLNCSNHIHHFIWGYRIQQLIILKVIVIETRCMQF